MKDQQIEKAMDGIENRIRHIYNCGYQQGYEDGKKAVNEQAEKITYTDIDEAYQRGYGDGRKAYMVNTIKQSDFSYQKGLKDAWECAKKIVEMKWEDCEKLFNLANLSNIIFDFTAQEAMQKIKDYEERQTETETWSNIHGQTITVPKGTFEKIFNDADEDDDDI